MFDRDFVIDEISSQHRLDRTANSATRGWRGNCTCMVAMLKITCTTNGCVVFALSGRLEAMSLQELSHLIARARPGRAVTLELKDLLLADREAVGFLRACLEKGIELRNCPRYIRTWMQSDEDGVRES
jgi:hypothetical protein